jgi:HD-like signal output (HDOD) protein
MRARRNYLEARIGYENVNDFLSKIDSLPALPDNLERISAIIADEKAGIGIIADVIVIDQGMAAKILTIANSPFYGRLNKITSLTEAVVVIGLKELKSTLYSMFMSQFYDAPGKDGQLMNRLWIHSVCTAELSAKLAVEFIPEEKQTAYLTGLMHDAGEIILLKYDRIRFLKLMEELKSEKVLPRQVLENQLFGFTHAELAASVVKKWNIPSKIRNAILFHDNPENQETPDKLTCCVCLADSLSAAAGAGGSAGFRPHINVNKMLSKNALAVLGIDGKNLASYMDMAISTVKSTRKLADSIIGNNEEDDNEVDEG